MEDPRLNECGQQRDRHQHQADPDEEETLSVHPPGGREDLAPRALPGQPERSSRTPRHSPEEKQRDQKKPGHQESELERVVDKTYQGFGSATDCAAHSG